MPEITAQELLNRWQAAPFAVECYIGGYRPVASVAVSGNPVRVIIKAKDGHFARKWPSSPVKIRQRAEEPMRVRTDTQFHEVLNKAPIPTLFGMLGIVTGVLTKESEPASLAEAYDRIHENHGGRGGITEGARRAVIKAIIDAELVLDAQNGELWTENQYARFVVGLTALPVKRNT